MGDVDGDGLGDVLVGAPGFNGAGAPAYLVTAGAPDAEGDGVGDDADCDPSDPTVAGPVTRSPDDAADATTWFPDFDGDGFGDGTKAVRGCTQPPGTVTVGGDCDDAHAVAHPGASELCDRLDNDCNGLVDDSAPTAPSWWPDADGDHWGAPGTPERECRRPAESAGRSGDCDDADPNIHPGAADPPDDGIDQDCDGA